MMPSLTVGDLGEGGHSVGRAEICQEKDTHCVNWIGTARMYLCTRSMSHLLIKKRLAAFVSQFMSGRASSSR
jgi:hypothetical protein